MGQLPHRFAGTWGVLAFRGRQQDEHPGILCAMPRPLRFAMAAIVLVMSAVVAVPFVRLHTASPLERTDSQIADGALPRLKFLRQSLGTGAAQQMQGLFP